MRWNEVHKEWELVSVATSAPLVAMDTLKYHSRVFPDPAMTYEDPLFTTFCLAAEKVIEPLAEITIRQKVMKLHLASWPDYCDYLRIRYELPPVTAITHIKYYDYNDTQQTLSSSLYENWFYRSPPETLIRAENVPELTTQRSRVVEIQVTAGHTGSIPETCQLAILELVAFWFTNREAYGRIPAPTDGAQGRMFQTLIDTLRWRMYP